MQASIETVESVRKHPNADLLDLATILGYQTVVTKDKYKLGDLIIFIRPDSVLPDEEWAKELKKYAPKRVKAIKIRHEWSEGLVIDLDTKPLNLSPDEIKPGLDVTTHLSIVHYEPPVGYVDWLKLGLPHDIPKTDEVRWEEIKYKIPYGSKVDITLKVDGQSWSAYYIPEKDEFGILGRKTVYDPKIDTGNAYVAHVARYDLETKLKDYCTKHNVALCIRGESYGPGIQTMKKNPHCRLAPGVAIFSVYLINERKYAERGSDHYFLNVCKELDIPSVPVLEQDVILTPEHIHKYGVELTEVNGQSFEGVVVKCEEGMTFKVINKAYDSVK